MNPVVARLALASLLGRKRSWLLIGLAGLLFIVAGLTRWGSGADIGASSILIQNFGLGTLVPVMCLLIGTGVIAPEIEDGSVVYILAKPLPRATIVLTKLAVAEAVAVVFTVLPVLIATQISGDEGGRLALGMGLATALASVAYTSVFFAIAVLTKNPTIIGLIYALLWEGTLAGYIPGVKSVSIRQWALAPAESMLSSHPELSVSSDVGLPLSVVLLVAVTAGGLVAALWKLQRLTVRVGD